MEVYIDKDYKCHISNQDGAYRQIETDFFDGKCSEYIEGYRLVPNGETWLNSEGVAFVGEMVAPWKPYDELDAAQREYEKQLLGAQAAELEDMRSALNKLGVTLDE